MAVNEKTILVVDDEEPIRRMVCMALDLAGYQSMEAADAESAYRTIHDQRPDLVLLDWMMPDVSGVELARRLRREELTRDLPLIMLTARVEEGDRIHGLDAGADDYVTKPFSPRELMARIRAVLRRSTPPGIDEAIEIEGLVLDPVSHRVSAGGNELQLGPTEFRLLQFLISHPERAYTRAQLLDHVWGNVYVEERTVDVHVRRVRKALEPTAHDWLIQTVRGTGYRFSTQRGT